MKKLLTLLAVVLCLTACGQAGASWQEQYDLGEKYLSEGNYEEAVIAFTAAIDIAPKRPEAYVGRGDSYAGLAEQADETTRMELYNSALADYLLAIDLDDQLVEVYKKAALMYIQLGDMESAQRLLARGLELTGSEELRAEQKRVKPTIFDMTWTGFASYSADGTLTATFTGTKNAAGKVVAMKGVTFDDGEPYSEGNYECFYDEYGRLVKTISYLEMETYVSELRYDEDGCVYSDRAEFEYDPSGRILYERYNGGHQENHYFYDEAGRLSRVDTYLRGELSFYLLFQYDEP